MQSPQEKENTSFAKKLYGSISKKFSGSKLAEELGEVRLGQVGVGEVRLGEVGVGEVRLGEVRLGEVRLGEVGGIEGVG